MTIIVNNINKPLGYIVRGWATISFFACVVAFNKGYFGMGFITLGIAIVLLMLGERYYKKHWAHPWVSEAGIKLEEEVARKELNKIILAVKAERIIRDALKAGEEDISVAASDDTE